MLRVTLIQELKSPSKALKSLYNEDFVTALNNLHENAKIFGYKSENEELQFEQFIANIEQKQFGAAIACLSRFYPEKSPTTAQNLLNRIWNASTRKYRSEF